ncbi:hypothetical protein CGRA01v4_01426 [Colletotrichum graminicola]|nr:hypothetical protein CGRA01v4_01426 [Colletotrichum graminicola]
MVQAFWRGKGKRNLFVCYYSFGRHPVSRLHSHRRSFSYFGIWKDGNG